MDSNGEEVEMEKLESDVRVMARKVSEYRHSLPDTLVSTLSPALLPIASDTDANVVLGAEEHHSGDKLIQLKERTSRNAADIPKVVKRVRECIEGFDKLNSLDLTIPPAFTRPTS